MLKRILLYHLFSAFAVPAGVPLAAQSALHSSLSDAYSRVNRQAEACQADSLRSLIAPDWMLHRYRADPLTAAQFLGGLVSTCPAFLYPRHFGYTMDSLSVEGDTIRVWGVARYETTQPDFAGEFGDSGAVHTLRILAVVEDRWLWRDSSLIWRERTEPTGWRNLMVDGHPPRRPPREPPHP